MPTWILLPYSALNHFPYQHLQRTHNDFARQILLPQMCSYIGPSITQGDVNKDGLVFILVGTGTSRTIILFNPKRDPLICYSA